MILLSDEVITQGVLERAGEKPLGVKYIKHQVQSVSTHVINEHDFQPKQNKNLSIRIEFNSWRISWGHQHGRRDVTLKQFMQNLQHIPYLWSAPGSCLFGSCSGGGKKDQQCFNCCTTT